MNEVASYIIDKNTGQPHDYQFAGCDPIIKQNLTAGTFFIGYNDVLMVDGAYERELSTPSRLPEKTDLKVSVIGTAGAVCSTSLSGWIEEL
jgi:hypothetical protein